MANNKHLARTIAVAAVTGYNIETPLENALERDILHRLENGMSEEDVADWAADVVDIRKAEESMEGEFA